MNIEQIVKEIVKEQSMIIGDSLARNRAEASGAVKFRSSRIEDLYVLDGEGTLDKIINSYAQVFGNASIRVCNEVVRKFQVTS